MRQGIWILVTCGLLLVVGLVFAQEYTGQLPPAAVKEPPQSLFTRIPQSISSVEPPPVLIFKRPAVVIRSRTPWKKELKIMVFRHPLSFSSFFQQYENSTILILRLIGLTPRQARNMSVFCFKDLVYEGPFAQQIIFKIVPLDISGGSEPCIVAMEYEEQLGSGRIETLQGKFSLPKGTASDK